MQPYEQNKIPNSKIHPRRPIALRPFEQNRIPNSESHRMRLLAMQFSKQNAIPNRENPPRRQLAMQPSEQNTSPNRDNHPIGQLAMQPSEQNTIPNRENHPRRQLAMQPSEQNTSPNRDNQPIRQLASEQNTIPDRENDPSRLSEEITIIKEIQRESDKEIIIQSSEQNTIPNRENRPRRQLAMQPTEQNIIPNRESHLRRIENDNKIFLEKWVEAVDLRELMAQFLDEEIYDIEQTDSNRNPTVLIPIMEHLKNLINRYLFDIQTLIINFRLDMKWLNDNISKDDAYHSYMWRKIVNQSDSYYNLFSIKFLRYHEIHAMFIEVNRYL